MRSQVVLLQGEQILLARHRRPGHTYWVLPGGAIEGNETPEEAAIREIREETGLDIEVERLLFTDEPGETNDIRLKERRYTFLGRIRGGTLISVEDQDGGDPEKGYLEGAEWRSFDSGEYDDSTRQTLSRVARRL